MKKATTKEIGVKEKNECSNQTLYKIIIQKFTNYKDAPSKSKDAANGILPEFYITL